MTALLKVRGLGYAYTSRQTTRALDGVDLDLASGEYVAIVGPSGCGKTTLLRLVARLLLPSEGTLEWGGGSAPRQALVFQEDGLFPWMNLTRNIGFALECRGLPVRESDEAARSALERLGLGAFAASYPHAISPGMRQRVALARALVVAPELLLLDEPFASLDAQSRWALQSELAATCGTGRYSVLHVTHDLEEALLLADRVLVLSRRPGRVIDEVRVPLPRNGEQPRDRHAPELLDLKRRLWRGLESEVRHELSLAP